MRELKRKKLEKQFAQIDQSYRDEPENWEGAVDPEDLKVEWEAEALGVGLELVLLKNFLNWDSLTREEDKSCRTEIIQDIAPIVTFSSTGDEVSNALEKLVAKINAMNICPQWGVRDENYERLLMEGNLFGARGPVIGLEYVPAGPVMHIAGKKFSVAQAIDTSLPVNRQGFYSAIIKTLQDGSFQKLKRCKECQRFFIADRLSDKFCLPECSKAYFDRGALDRVRESREKKKAESSGKKRSKKQYQAKGKRRRRK